MKKLLIVVLLLSITSPLCATEDHLQQGANHLSAGNYKKAVRSFELAIKATRDSAGAYKGLGMAYYKLGNYEIGYDVEMLSAAVTAFNQSLALKQDPEVCFFLGLSHLALYDKQNAEAAYECLKSTDPKLAGQLAEKLSAYVKPAKFNYSHSPAPQGDSTTSVVIEGNRVLVPVTVTYRDRPVQAMLLLDTGASVTVISERLAEQLGVDAKDTHRAMATVADGRDVECRWFIVDTLAVGPKSYPGLRPAIVPGSGMKGEDGLLGMDFLKNFRYHVDFSRNVIEWNKR
jgi:hypothetical protein